LPVSGIRPLDAARIEAARLLARGLTRHFALMGQSAIPEVTLPNGRRADLVVLSRTGEIAIVEIKSSIEDLMTDRKWRDYGAYCDRFYFASHVGVPEAIFPAEAGFILCDAFGAEIIRESERTPLPAPTRKALTIGLARLATQRLIALIDPEACLDSEF
jgi:hypothetical protein